MPVHRGNCLPGPHSAASMEELAESDELGHPKVIIGCHDASVVAAPKADVSPSRMQQGSFAKHQVIHGHGHGHGIFIIQ